jgi:transcriptional activator for dhaKLM operon
MESTIKAAWQTFQITGNCNETAVAPPVLRSWARCRALGLTATTQPICIATNHNPSDEALVSLARPYLEDLYQGIEGSGLLVVLANPSLTLITAISDEALSDSVAHHGLAVGVTVSEASIGTMAINLAHRETLPCQTSGAEHFLERFHHFACSAAPLFDVQGQTVGILGVICPATAAHPHTLGMVIATAQAIHNQLRNNQLLTETNNHLAELNAAIEAMSEGLLILDQHGRISKMNSRAGQMLHLVPRSVSGRLFNELLELPSELVLALEQRGEINDQELIFTGRKGPIATISTLRPIWDRSKHHLGSLLVLRPTESVQRLLQRVGGAQARFTFADIVGETPLMQTAVRQARIAARSNAPVLIQGETGVGKQLFAHAIHNGGNRATGPFISLDCNAISRSLILGELLGYAADQRTAPSNSGQLGKLELAHGGTLMIEDITALPLEAQTSLLRVIETQHLIRVGGQRAVPIDVRVIALSSRDLQHEVDEGRFRAELFYRLSVVTITIPPLRQRGNDLLILINQILLNTNRRLGKTVLLAPDALATLANYPWHGNMRELETILERLLQSTEQSILTAADLPANIVQPTARQAETHQRLHESYADNERATILQAGRETAGHLGRTAARLGISRATLWRKMRQYGIQKEQFWLPHD